MVTELGTSDLRLKVETRILTKGERRKKASPAESLRGQRGDRRWQGKVQGVLQGCGRRGDWEEGLWTLRRPTGSCKPLPQEAVCPAWGGWIREKQRR